MRDFSTRDSTVQGFDVEPNILLAVGAFLSAGLAVIVFLLVIALRRAHTYTRQRRRELDAFARIENALAANAEYPQTFANALDLLLEFSHAAAVQLWLEADHLAPTASHLHRGLFPESFVSPPAPTGRIQRHTNTKEFPQLSARGFVELVQVPLVYNEHSMGILEIAARHRGELQTLTDEWLETVAHTLATTVANEQELARLRSQLADERRLWGAGLEVIATEDYEQLLRTIVDRARELLHMEASALCLWNQDRHLWVVQGTGGTSEAFEIGVTQFERGDGGRVECPVVRFNFRQAHLDLPVRRNGHIIGCLCVASQQPREFSTQERALLTGIAAQAALAVERTRALETMGSRAATVERERLAREIHDTLAQILGFVNIKTGAAREWLAQGNVTQAQTELEQLALLSQELYADTRELILGLHGARETGQGITRMIQDYIDRFSQFCNLPTEFAAFDAEVQFSPAVEVQLLRVVQEALSNVRKHARANHAWVSMTHQHDRVVLEIRDDGQGFDPAHPPRGFGPHFGIQSMRERVESIHGTLTVHSAPGQGTTVRASVPVIHRGADT